MSDELKNQMTALKVGMSVLDEKDQVFARSLCAQYESKGYVSAAQHFWVVKLLGRCSGATAEPVTETVANLGGLISLFDRAAGNKLKWPKITLDASEVGVPLQLSRAGETARQPFTVNLTDGRPYGSNTWYGRVERNGTFVPGRDCDPAIVEFLQRLGDDTANVAAMYGKRTGCCCFCNTALTDERSISVGYGPTCAKKWELPYPTAKQFREAAAASADLLAA